MLGFFTRTHCLNLDLGGFWDVGIFHAYTLSEPGLGGDVGFFTHPHCLNRDLGGFWDVGCVTINDLKNPKILKSTQIQVQTINERKNPKIPPNPGQDNVYALKYSSLIPYPISFLLQPNPRNRHGFPAFRQFRFQLHNSLRGNIQSAEAHKGAL